MRKTDKINDEIFHFSLGFLSYCHCDDKWEEQRERRDEGESECEEKYEKLLFTREIFTLS